MPDLRPGFLEVPEGTMVYRNTVSGVQHLKKAGGLKFMCGRRQNDRYSFYAGKPVKGVALCDHCMSSKEVSGLLAMSSFRFHACFSREMFYCKQFGNQMFSLLNLFFREIS